MLQAILVSIVAFLAAIDEYTFGASMMGRPLFTAPIVGLILGDFQAGIMIGATLELIQDTDDSGKSLLSAIGRGIQ